jgi:uncharacterized protein (DUF1330 family)
MAAGKVLIVVEVIEVLDDALFAIYRSQARQQLAELGGTLLARGGTLFEGYPPLSRSMLVQQWSSEREFRAWQASAAYAPLLKLRKEAARLRITIVPEAN